MSEDINPYKIRSVKGFRRKKGLCPLCGKFKIDDIHECIENYIKTDMTSDDIPKDQQVSSEEKMKELTEDARIKTVLNYRFKKDLCKRCGRTPTDDCLKEVCIENYDKSDNREIESQIDDPRTIITPRKKDISILDVVMSDISNKEIIENTNDSFLKLVGKMNPNYLMPYIIVDISVRGNNKIDYSFIEFLNKKYKFIICLLGDITKFFTIKQCGDVKKLPGVIEIKNLLDQNIVDHLTYCKHYFGFTSKYSEYCITRKIPITLFVIDDIKNYKLNGHNTIIKINENDNVDINTIKRNISSWRI